VEGTTKKKAAVGSVSPGLEADRGDVLPILLSVAEGKYDSAGNRIAPLRVPLPFQTVETVNESTADRRHTLELFGQHRQTEWRNRLIWGDKKYVLPSLLAEFAGKVNLIYIDPPFDTGADFSFTASVPNHPDEDEDEAATTFTKEPSIIEHKAYRDRC
jgi:adenine-specific DNA-methyltransferase